VTWLDGVELGSSDSYDAPRVYRVPRGVAREGRNLLAVRVYDSGGNGGFTGEAAALRIGAEGEAPLGLAGEWRYRVGLDLDDLAPLPPDPASPNRPAVLYNAMLEPLAPYALRGFLWYQGESNADRAHQYRSLFQTLIRDWRAAWGGEELPFYFVQLASFLRREPEPGPSDWAELREAQAMALALPATGMAVTIDIGESQDIHPTNKQDVGKRLALAARALAYGERDLVYSGPIYRQMSVEGSKARLWFDHVGGGLTVRGDGLMGFEVAGADGQFRPAQAAIEGDTIVAWSPAVAKPVAVRYAWERDPAVSLFNKEGLPASPFRTDRWRR
jgi:sialate O-acetylesterase